MFEYRQAEEVRDAFAAHGVRFLFLGKSGAILLGYPDTTQDADVYLEKSAENGKAVFAALVQLGFEISEDAQQQILRGKDFIQLKNGPFDLDLIFAQGGSSVFQMPGLGGPKLPASRSVPLTTSLPVKKPRIVPRIESRWHGWKAFENTSDRADDAIEKFRVAPCRCR